MHGPVSMYARMALAAFTVLGSVHGADAQGLGYGVGGLAGVSGFFASAGAGHVAGGGEALFRGRAGIAGEVGLINNLTLGSANGVAHLVPSRAGHRLSPFVTGGWTRMSSGEGTFDAWNAGGGLDVWPRDRVGFRLEFRDHIRPDSRGNVHYWTIRGGIAFR